MNGELKSKPALIQKHSEINLKKAFLLIESKERH